MLPLWLVHALDRWHVLRYLGDYFTVGQQSTRDVIHSLTQNEELRAVLLYMVPAIGFALDSSWYITAAVYMHYITKGCWYPVGGSHSIVAGLTQTVLANGGQVMCRARVAQILVDGSGCAYGECASRLE